MKDSARPEFWDERFAAGITPWDLGGVPSDLKAWLATPRGRLRALVPGCGSAYEARYLAELDHDVTAIDFSDAALAAALKVLGADSFLCALPRSRWSDWGARLGSTGARAPARALRAHRRSAGGAIARRVPGARALAGVEAAAMIARAC